MNKKSIIEQIQAHGAVAAHATGRYVDIVRNVPVSVVLATPIYMAKEKLRKGDKIAIIDMDENLAFICPVTQVETSSLSKIQTLSLGKAKKVRLE
jgi:hypothetical protein